jgi:hypothetical protein
MPDQQLPYHPLLASLAKDTTLGNPGPESAIKFSGYVGPASQDGLVRLYVTLNDLSHYIEFERNAVVQTSDTPESILPDKAVTIWVKGSTRVRGIREYASATALYASIASGFGQQPTAASSVTVLGSAKCSSSPKS